MGHPLASNPIGGGGYSGSVGLKNCPTFLSMMNIKRPEYRKSTKNWIFLTISFRRLDCEALSDIRLYLIVIRRRKHRRNRLPGPGLSPLRSRGKYSFQEIIFGLLGKYFFVFQSFCCHMSSLTPVFLPLLQSCLLGK